MLTHAADAHFGSYFGLTQAMMALLRSGHEPDHKDDGYKQTLLSCAAMNGQVGIMKLFLALPKDQVNGDSRNIVGLKSLSLELTEKSSRPRFQRREWMTPLSVAANSGREAVVKLLLAGRTIVSTQIAETQRRAALSMAAACDNEALVAVLLANDRVDPNCKDDHERTPLLSAASLSNEVAAADEDGVSPLLIDIAWLWSSGQSQVDPIQTVRLLANDVVDPNCEIEPGPTALWLRNKEEIKLLKARPG